MKEPMFDVDWGSDTRFEYAIGYIPYAFHLLPPFGLARVAGVMRRGEMDGRPDDGWRKVPVQEQINHVLYHLHAFLDGTEGGEDHLANAGCRVLMALDLDSRKEKEPESDSPSQEKGYPSYP